MGNLAGVPAARLPVRVVVLNHNGGEHTVRAFRHLSRTEWPADELELVCVDNASTDGSVEALAAQMPTVAVRQVGRNEGFPANNHALRDLDGVRYVALVNNDAFVEPGWLAPLVEALDDDPGLGAACPKLVFAPRFVDVSLSAPRFDPGPSDPRPLGVMVRGVEVDGRDAWRAAHASGGGHGREADAAGTFEWLAPEAVLRVPVDQDGGRRATLWLQARSTVTVTVDGGAGRRAATVGPSPTPVAVELAGEPYDVVNNVGSVLFDDGHGADRGWLAADDGTWDAPVEVFAWCGGAVLLRRSYLDDVGLFDERLFMYYEDTDLSWRGRLRGWRYVYEPGAVVRHHHAQSSGVGSPFFRFHTERNRLLVLAKNAPAGLAWRAGLGEVRRLVGALARHYVIRPLTLRLPARAEVAHRWRVCRSYLRLLPGMLGDRWSTTPSVSRRSLMSWEVVKWPRA